MMERVSPRGAARFRGWLLLLACILWGPLGCKVGPEYLRPDAPVADGWIDSAHPQLQGEPVDPRYWWTSFNDPLLSEVVERAHRDNLSVREAGMRVLEARANYGIATGNLFPQNQQITSDLTHTKISGNRPNFPRTPIPGFNTSFDDYSLGYAANWELDFWGRFRRAIDAAHAELDASVENHDDVLVILLGETASSYIEMRTFERRIQLAQENAGIQRKTLQLVKNRLDAGTVTELDYAQSETNLRDTEALIPHFERLHREANNRLCVLLGLPVRDLSNEIGNTGDIPLPPQNISVNPPADLLRRRPDVRRAERLLAAQSERIGIATAEFYPHLSINGNIGLDSGKFSSLFDSNSITGSVNPSLRWNFLNYGRIRNNVRAQDARFQQLAYAYRHQVLKADAEVENGIVGFIKSHEQVGFLRQSAKAARRAVELSIVRYEGGKADFNEVFLLQAQLVRKLDAVAVTEGDVAKSFVSIYRGLGGGWEIRLGGVPQTFARAETNASADAPQANPGVVPEAKPIQPAPVDAGDGKQPSVNP
jgi:NodT family efflux transporter outer membrane factor (OMF) lipoprotein